MTAAAAVAAPSATYPRQQTEPPQCRAAVAYGLRGWPVFPCKPRDKRPLITDWPHQASTDPATIRAWWHKYPQANVAIVPPAGLVVIDIDAKAGGLAWLAGAGAALCPPTLTSETGGGGLHLLYTVPPDAPIRQSAGEIAPGVDVRAPGRGYIVAPPSLHPSGGLYHWRAGAGPDECEPAAAPWPLLALLTTAPAPAPGAVPETPRPAPVESAPWSMEQLLAEARRKTSANNRNITGFWLACQLRDEGYSESEAESVLRQYQQGVTDGADPYTWTEARASLRSAYRRPPRDPRIGRRQRTAPPAAVDSTGVIADVDPGAVDWSDLYREMDALQSENAALRAELAALAAPVDKRIAQLTAERDALQAWKDKALEVLLGTNALDTADRVGLIALQQWIEEQNLPMGEKLEVSQQAMAARWSVSPSTVSRWLDKWDAMEITGHEAGPDPRYPVLDRNGQPRYKPDGAPMLQNRTYLACNKRPFEVEIAVLKSPPGKKGQQHGGKRECPHCGAAGTEQEVIEVRHCRKCHTLYHANGKIIALGSNVQDASGEINSCMMQVDHDGSALRALADDLRAQAPDSPRIAEKVARTRRRYQVQTLIDAADAHHYAPNLHDASRSPVPSFARPPAIPDAPLLEVAV